MKAKTSDTDPTPFLGKQEKVGENYEITEKFNSVDGELVDIEWATYTYEGDTKYKCKFTLQDIDGSRTVVESGFNGVLYSILNSFANYTGGIIDVQLWLGKEKEGKRWAQGGVKLDGENLKWKHEYANLPKPEVIKAGKKTVKDDSQVVEFWAAEIDKIKANLAKIKASKELPVSEEENNNDSLPF